MTGNSHKYIDDISVLPENGHTGLRGLVDELPIGMLSCDKEGNITAVNDFLLKLLGSPSAKTTKKINMLTFAPLVESGISASIQEALTTGETTSIETPYRSKWSKELFVSFRTFPRKDSNGDIYGFYAIIEDLTTEMDANFEIEKNRIRDQIITRISDRFINTSLKDIDTNINITLKDLAHFIGAERATLFSTDESTDFLLKTHEWYADGVESRITLNEKWDYKKLVSSGFNNSQIINIPNVSRMPEDCKEAKKILQELGISSIAMIPFSHHEHFKGLISVDSNKEIHTWKEKDLYVLKIAGNLIASILERKNTENLLLEKEKEYENTIDSLDAIIWKATFDHEGSAIQTYISKPMDKMLGFPADTIGTDWDRFFAHLHQDDIEKVQNNLKLAFSNPNTPVNVEYRVLSDDGKTTWVNSLGSSQPIGHGFYQMAGTTSNITDRKIAEEKRKKAESKLRENEGMLRLLIDYAPIALAMFDRKMRYIAASNQWLTDYHLGDIGIVGKCHYDIFPEIPEEWKDMHRRSMKGEVIPVEETRFKRVGGNVQWVRGQVHPWRKADGTIGGIVLLSEDITERRIAEKKIARSEAKHRSLFERSNDAIMILDTSGKILEANKMACELVGYSEDELKQMSMIDLTIPEDREDIRSRIKEISKEGHCRKDNRMMHSDGSIIYTDTTATYLEAEQELIQTIARDITDRVKAEESLLNAKIEAEIANRTKSDFLANMSHELRTPLNSIIGFSDAMIDGIAGEIDSKQEHYLQNISDSGHHLLSLINDILDISKIEAGKMELDIDMIDISVPVNEIVIMTQMLAVNKNLTVDVDLSDNIPKVMADRSKIKQILYNLIGNAIKFTDDNGNITIRAEVKDSNLQVSIIDTGIGISPKDQEKLFKPFTQIDSSRSRKYAGTGLGLALVKEIVECHGGKVWVESKPGKGSNFTFELPIDLNRLND